ncbi:MAG: SOS response-associated peptidase [Thiobacillus sp.]
MCGRFALKNPQALKAAFDLNETLNLPPRYNIAPSQEVAAVRTGLHRRELVMLHWGLIPAWAKDMKTGYSLINARAETVAEKPAFRTAYKKRRCIIPASGFYEWKAVAGGKQPYYLTLKNDEPMGLAGLWEHWQSPEGRVIESCSILVTDANALVKQVHDRMPVILPKEAYAAWLDPEEQTPEHLASLLRPFDAEKMTAWPVSRQVNNPRNDEAGCLERAPS